MKKKIGAKRTVMKKKMGLNKTLLFLTEVTNHIDSKLKTTIVKVIPEIKNVFLRITKFNLLDVHCLSLEYMKQKLTSRNVECFITFCSSAMTLDLCKKPAEVTIQQKDNAL